MKKTLAILTMVVMLAALLVPLAMSIAETRAACDHPGVYIASEETVGPRYYSNSQHGYAVKRVAKCTVCNETLTTSYSNWMNLESHTPASTGTDQGHVGTTVKHKYKTNCSVCGGSYTYTKNCSWPCLIN